MKKFLALQVCALLLVSGSLAGMFAFTPVFNEVRSGIVLVLCLSCLKLEPNTASNFTFFTIDNVSHPDFVLENLTKGPVFLHYSGDSCAGCDVMLPVIQELFSVEFGKQDTFNASIIIDNLTIQYIYVNIHHTNDELKNTQAIYDKDHVSGIPMLTIITLGYDNGKIKPTYTSLYGTLSKYKCDTDAKRLAFLQDILQDSIGMYNDNRAGYSHH